GFFFPMLSMMDIILPGPKPLISDVRQSESSPHSYADSRDTGANARLFRAAIRRVMGGTGQARSSRAE
ncbi:hypothetical protein ACWCY6_39440, partial [Streptomyces sp. 900105755]